jgi:branched-subunit amino acid aminotransferase/4-amino-4-deoxychorismate lyase
VPLACLDGRVLDAADARLPVTDDGLLRGDGVFEVVRLYAGRPFALDDHLARLDGSARGLRLPVDLGALRSDVGALLDAAPGHDGVVRLLVTRGGHRLAVLEDLRPGPPAAALASVTYAPTRLLDGVKSLSYAANMLAGRLAAERGADEALLVTPHGRVLEGPTRAFFYVLDGRLCTPPLDDHILDSITRRRLIALVEVTERPTPLTDLARASEAFLASTTREVLPVRRVDDVELEAPGPRTREAAAAFRAHVEAELGVAVSPSA